MCRQIQYSFVDNTLGYQPSLVTFIERKKKKKKKKTKDEVSLQINTSISPLSSLISHLGCHLASVKQIVSDKEGKTTLTRERCRT